MKKLLFLFAVLLGTVGAWAQTSQKYYKPGPRTLTLEAGKKYFISVATYYGGACTNLLYNNNGTLAKSNLLPNVITFESSYIFTVEEVGDGYLAYIKNSSDKYIQADNLASTETKTGVYVIPYFTGKAVCCGDDVDACDANGNKIAYKDITAETPIVTVQKNADYTKAENKNGWRYIDGLSAGVNWCTAFAFYEAEEVESPMELTTDTSKPILYTIKNLNGGAYVAYDGASHSMRMSPLVENASFMFYFTQGTTPGTFKIHNYVTDKKCENYNSWTEDGRDWYIKPSGCTSRIGLAIAKQEQLTDGNTQNEAWNNYKGESKEVALFGGNDGGSVWNITKYEGEIPTLQFSTEENITLNYIRSIRQDSYVNFDGHNSTFKEASLGLFSYWYFIKDEAEQENAPKGFVACRIYNAAHGTAVANFASGYMEDETNQAKVFYIGLHEASNSDGEGYGYIIRLKDDPNNGWHDITGTHIINYSLGDRGSHWRIYPADKTPDNLKSEAATAKTNALNKIAHYEYADYYTYADDAIATAKATVEGIDATVLSSAVISLKEATANTAMTTLEASKKGSTAPVVGDVVRLKNRQYNDFLSVNGSNDLFGAASGGNELYWTLEATDVDGYYYLYNKEKNVYAKPLADANNQKTSVTADKNDAGKYGFKLVGTTVYAALHDNHLGSGEGDASYLHHSNWPGKEMVRWNMQASTSASHWLVSQAFPLTVVFKFKGEDIAEHKVETLLDKGATYTINNPYAGTNKYIAIGECTTTGSQPVETDGVWTVKVTEATTITVTLVDDLPFKVSESYANATWYYMNIRSDDKKYVAMSDATEYSNVAKPAADDKSLWAFMGDANGIQIINKAAGEEKTLSFEGDAADDKAVVMREEKKTWTIERAATGFLLRAGNTGNLYVHDLKSKLKIWNSTSAPTDKGSAFNVVEDKGVKSLEELVLNPRYIDIYTIEAERSPLMYSATETTKLSSGLLDGVVASETDINQQFLILRTPSTPEGYFYLYSLGAEKFVDESLNFIDFPSPVLSLVASEHPAYPWRVKIDDKFVIPGTGGTDANKIYHTSGGNDDGGKRYRIVKVGESYNHSVLLNKLEEAEYMIKATSELSNEKVYTVSTIDGGSWYYNSEQNALWSTGKAGVEFSAQDPAQQIAFLTVSGHTYLYSIGAQKFVVKAGGNTAYSDVPSQSIELLDAEGSRFYPFVAAFVDGDNRHHIGISNGYDIPVITDWNNLNDNGNKIKLREVTPGYMAEGAADLLAAAVTKIDNYLAVQEFKPELATKIAEVQALLGKNYLDVEDSEKLSTAKDAAQTVHDKAGATSAELTEQINLLTQAIADVTYVTEISEFKNCYLYTFVSKRGWMVATDANTVKSADEGAADNPLHQWAVYKSAKNNNYYLYNLGKQQFMGFANVQNEEIPFAATPQVTTLTFKKSSWEDYPIMFSVDNKGVVNNNNRGAMIYWNNGWTNLQDDGNNHKVTLVGAVPSETLTAIESKVVFFEATHALDVAIAAVQAKVDVMDKLGYYSSSNENFEAEFNDIKDFKAAITAETAVDAINAQTTAANSLVATFTVLNEPQTGKFYRLKGKASEKYMSTPLSTDAANRVKMRLSENPDDAGCIFYLTANNKLLSYKLGTFLQNTHDIDALGESNGNTVYFNKSESNNLGFFTLKTDNSGSKYIYDDVNDTEVDRNGSYAANNCEWTVEEVTELPLTIHSSGKSTYSAPVDLKIPDGVTVYYAEEQVGDSHIRMYPLTGMIPANTGVVVQGKGTVSFPITTGAAALENNLLIPVVEAQRVTPETGNSVFVMATKNGETGFYPLSKTNNVIGGHKSYLEISANSAARLSIIWDDTETGIFEVEGGEQNTEIYDLTGRRLDKPVKGINIIGGKLVIK